MENIKTIFEPGNLLTFCLVLVALALLFLLAVQVIEAARKLRRTNHEQVAGVEKQLDEIRKEIADIRQKLSDDFDTLKRHEREIKLGEDGTRELIIAVMALLNHELHNGNSQEMEEAARSLQQWLVGR